MTLDEILERELERLEDTSKRAPGAFWKKFRRSRPAVIVLAIAIVFLQMRGLPREFSNTTLDAAAILQPPVHPKYVRMVTIDEQEYQTAFGGVSPLNPAKLASLLTAIGKGGPALVVVDIDTSHPMFKSMDVPHEIPIVWTTSAAIADNSSFEPQKPLGGASLPANWRVALDLVPRDEKGVVRSYARRFPVKGGTHMSSLEYAASQAYKRLPEKEFSPSDNQRLLDFRYKFYPITAQQIREKSTTAGWSNGALHGAIVVLGGTFKEARDQYATPTRLMDGSELVSQGIEAEIENTGVPLANPWVAGLFQMLAGFCLVVLYRLFSLRTALLTSIFLIPILSLSASLMIFHRLALWAAMVPVLLAVLVTELYTQAALYLSWCKRFDELNKSEKADLLAKNASAAGSD